MFKFLKDKLKSAISSISEKIKSAPEESKEEPETEIKKIKIPKKNVVEEPAPELEVQDRLEIEKPEIKPQPEIKVEEIEVKEPEKKGFFAKIKEKITTTVTTTTISESKFDELFETLEMALLENNVAYEVIEKIKQDLKSKLVDNPIKRSEIEDLIEKSLKKSIEELFSFPKIDLIKLIKDKKDKPFVIVFFGVNGVGKTSSIAKIAHYLKKNNISVVLAAADTFRAGSREQLEEWGAKLKVKVIAHNYRSDPAAVAFDGRRFCEANNIGVLLVDTAGRQHSNKNLMQEMEKIVRVVKPDLKIFIAESLVGNDAISQSENFNNSIGIDGIILTKADVDEKGGVIVSISYITKKTIFFLGTGQSSEDLQEFNKEEVIKRLGL